MSNSVTEKKISKLLRENKKSMDEIQQHIYDTIILNQLTTGEVAALFTSLMRQVLTTSHNQALLDRLGLDSGKLNPEAISQIQMLLTIEWLDSQGLLKK
ncbi:hypothetical protein ACVR1I_06585 [Streptococcus cameli]